MTAGTCRFCECTDSTPCPGGCAWTDDTQTLCTVCLGAAAIAVDLVRAVGAIASRSANGLDLVHAGDWERLTIDQQRLVVTACRTHLDAAQLVLATEAADDALENAIAVDTIAGYLLEHFPHEIDRVPDQDFSQVVIRLLDASRRAIVPGATV